MVLLCKFSEGHYRCTLCFMKLWFPRALYMRSEATCVYTFCISLMRHKTLSNREMIGVSFKNILTMSFYELIIAICWEHFKEIVAIQVSAEPADLDKKEIYQFFFKGTIILCLERQTSWIMALNITQTVQSIVLLFHKTV